jgi:hypothetical protein
MQPLHNTNATESVSKMVGGRIFKACNVGWRHLCSSLSIRNPILSTTIERWVWTPWIFKTVDTVSTDPG